MPTALFVLLVFSFVPFVFCSRSRWAKPSGTAVAANYGEARGAESRADFIHQPKVVFKELNQTTIAREGAESSLLSPEKIVAIVAENRELCRIIAASIKTARASTEGLSPNSH